MKNKTIKLYNILIEKLNKIETAEEYRKATEEIRNWARFNLLDEFGWDIIYPENLEKLLKHLEEKKVLFSEKERREEFSKLSKDELIDKILKQTKQ